MTDADSNSIALARDNYVRNITRFAVAGVLLAGVSALLGHKVNYGKFALAGAAFGAAGTFVSLKMLDKEFR